MKIRQNSLLIMIYLIAMSILIYIFWGNYSGNIVFCAALMPVYIHSVFRLIRKGYYLYALLIGYVSEIVLVMFLCFYILRIQENYWRLEYCSEHLNALTLQYMLLSLNVLVLLYHLFLERVCSVREKRVASVGKKNLALLYVLFGVICVDYLGKIPRMSLREYGGVGGAVEISLFRICFLIILMLFFHRDNKRSTILIAELSVGAVIVLSLVVRGGYRYIVAEITVVLIFMNLERVKRIRMKQWLTFGASVLLLYSVLIIIKRYLNGGSVQDYLFLHERNIFYSFSAIINNTDGVYVDTYWSTIKNLLPKFLTGSTDVNTGGMLMPYINSTIYQSSGITMGAFYLAEAYANFGAPGIFLSSAAIGGAICALEKKVRKSSQMFFFMLYNFVIAEMYNVVYYGSANYVKILVYYSIFTVFLFRRQSK